MIYAPIPSKYTKLEENFGGLMNKSLVLFIPKPKPRPRH